MAIRPEAHGTKAIMIMIAVPCTWAAALLCVANAVRVVTWRDMAPKIRYALPAANLSSPLAFGAFTLLR